MIIPSIEFAFTSSAQSCSSSSGISSQDGNESGSRRYTWAEDSLSTWNQISSFHAYLMSSSSDNIRRAFNSQWSKASVSRDLAHFRICPSPCKWLLASSKLSVSVSRIHWESISHRTCWLEIENHYEIVKKSIQRDKVRVTVNEVQRERLGLKYRLSNIPTHDKP